MNVACNNCGKKQSLRNKEYLLPILLLSVLIGTSASSSFQHVLASPKRAACATGLDNLVIDEYVLDTLSDSVLCLYRSGPDTTMRETCITDLLTVKSSPTVEAVAYVDTLSDAIICLAQTEQSGAEATNGTNGTNGTEATTGEACLPDQERLKDPDMPFAEVADIISKSIVCLAHT